MIRIVDRLFVPVIISLFILMAVIQIWLGQDWPVLAIEAIIIILVIFYWYFERQQVSSREIALMAMLAAIAAVARVPFAALPGVQPTTFLVIVSGYVFGSRDGFMVGAAAALLSNFFLGQGPWTLLQMLAWGMAGGSAGVMGRLYPAMGIKPMVMFSFMWGFLFGWITNLWSWLLFIRPLSWSSFILINVSSLWFDTFHALANAGFYLLFGSSFIKILRRFHRRLKVAVLPDLDSY